MNIKLLGDRVIVKHIGFQEESDSGFVITESDREAARRGTVMATGPGINGLAMTVKEGDTVLYGKDSGTKIEIENEKALIMRECDIYTVIE